MTPKPKQPANSNFTSLAHPLNAGLAALLAAAVAVSSQSFWIDEANSAIKALAHDWTAFISLMVVERGSDLQMPLYMALLWLWEKAVGSSELALRSLNVPLFVFAIAGAGGRTKISESARSWFVIFACVSPMVWAYLDEARPYTLQFLGGTLIMSALINLAHCDPTNPPKTNDAIAASVGAIILCGASLLGVIFTFFFGIAFIVLWFNAEPPNEAIRRPALWAICTTTVICLGVLGLYYAWTLTVGARASNAGRTNTLSLIFCGYELAGFSGAGPGRAELRDGGAGALVRFVPGLLAYTAAICIWMLVSLPTTFGVLFSSIERYFWIVGAAMVSLAAVVTLGLASDFRVLGRHLIPLLPFWLLGIAALSAKAFLHPSRLRRAGALALPFAMLISSLTLRFSPTHAKDDYRGAASVARDQLKEGKVVWWAADGAAAIYYSLQPATLEEHSAFAPVGNLYFANSRSEEYLSRLPVPSLIILSKTDIYDPRGTLRSYLYDRGFQMENSLPAMTFWKPAFERQSK